MSVVNPPRIAVISIMSQEVPTCVHFYKDVIGLPLDQHHGHHPTFNLGKDLFLVITKGKSPSRKDLEQNRFPKLAFAVDDLDIAMEKLQSYGVDFPWGVEKKDDSRWVLFYDPAGNLLEFVQFTGANTR